MTNDYYDPHPVQQADGSYYEWQNCTAASAATGLDRATSGKSKTTGARVRTLSGDTSGGLTLVAVDLALHRGWNVDIDVRWMIPFYDLCAEVASGHGTILQGGYSVFHAYHLAGSLAFFGNHAIWWNEVRLVWHGVGLDLDKSQAYIYDPLWDGRYSYVPSKQFRWVTLRMLYQFAAMLDLGSGKLVGAGRAYAGMVARTAPLKAGLPSTTTSIKVDYGSNSMITAGGLVLSSSHKMALKKGQPLYRDAKVGSPVVTKMSAAAKVSYMGNAGSGFRAVVVRTGNFADKVTRPVIVYVPSTAGPISKA